MADLRSTVSGINFPNPVLTAAGPNVRTAEMMLKAVAGGAGGIVAKTISVVPARDRRPTIRLAAGQGLMNSETWSEMPFDDFLKELERVKASGVPLIPSIGYKAEDVSRLAAILEKEIRPDAIEFSTHYTGKSIEPLVDVAKTLRGSVDLPIWMKVSPGVPDICELAEAASPYVDAFVAINSFGPVLDIDPETGLPVLGSESGCGWLSGPPIKPIALRIVSELTRVQDKPVVGVGGIERGVDAIKFFMAGASLVGVCSAAIKRGHGVYGRIAGEIAEWLDDRGSLEEIIGLYHKKVSEGRAGQGEGAGKGGGRPGEHGAPNDTAEHPVIAVSAEKCTGCGACTKRCIHEALHLEGEVCTVLTNRCIGCGFCRDFCSYGAMSFEKEMLSSSL